METKIANVKVLHSQKNKDLDIFKKAIKVAKRKNEQLYGFSSPKYRVVVCETLEEYKRKANVKNPVGGASVVGNDVIILTPSKRKGLMDTDFVMYHELNHLFFSKLNPSCKPSWLSEGIGLFDQRAYRVDKGWKSYLQTVKNVEKYLLEKTHQKLTKKERDYFYILSYFCTKYLVKEFGMKKIISFLKKIEQPYSKRKFYQQFEKTFKLTKKEFVALALCQ